jgi:molybdate transport system regulatory protein
MRHGADSDGPTLSLRIDLGPERRLGPGKVELLEAIAAYGSISAAGRALDMSYRRAWLLVADINQLFGRPAVERQTGGRAGGGAALTPFGRAVVRSYRRIERTATGAARRELDALRAQG